MSMCILPNTTDFCHGSTIKHPVLLFTFHFLYVLAFLNQKCLYTFDLDMIEDLELLACFYCNPMIENFTLRWKEKNKLFNENCLFCEPLFYLECIHWFLDLPILCGHSWLLRKRIAVSFCFLVITDYSIL